MVIVGELSRLPNIGKTIEEQLNSVGVHTGEQLREIGSKQAWLNIKKIDETACINRLLALEGAIQGIRWHYLPEKTKNELNTFYNSYNL